MDFEVLLSHAAGGDEEAWARLLREITHLARRTARRGRMDDADAGDLVQTVALVLLERMSVREPARLPGWLAATLGRQANRMLRRRCRELPLPDDSVLRAGQSPEWAALTRERDQALWLATARLPSSRARRLVHLLAYRPELTQKQLAVELDLAPGSVGPLRRRSLDALRGYLATTGFGPSDLR